MKRPQRHLAVLLAVVALSVWWPVPLALATLLLTVVMLAAGRQHFVARALMRRRRWDEAAAHCERFLQQQSSPGWRRVFGVVFITLYTRSAVAMAHNNLG